MPADPKFKARLRREVRLYVRELRDGCNECRAARGLCHDHGKVVDDLILHPRKDSPLKAVTP
jgi:hypothetical protein